MHPEKRDAVEEVMQRSFYFPFYYNYVFIRIIINPLEIMITLDIRTLYGISIF